MNIPRGTLDLLGFSPTGDLGPLTAYTSTRHGTVWFAKSPPQKAPSPWQVRQRDRFRLAAIAWRALTSASRARWHLACRRARLYLNGYTLWIYWQLTRDRGKMQTIEHNSGIDLIDPAGSQP